jgi:AcrR family transcriptional regulator
VGNRTERRQRIEQRLLDATERLMNDGASFTELAVDRLSTAAGISRANFYIYFEDKGDLLRRLAGRVFDELTDGAQRWWAAPRRHNLDDVHTAMAAIIAAYRRHQPVLVALNEMSTYDAATAAVYRELITDVAARLTQVIEDGQADDAIRAGLPAADAASALTWMVERTCQQNLPANPPEYDTELASTLAEIVWHALYAKPTTRLSASSEN